MSKRQPNPQTIRIVAETCFGCVEPITGTVYRTDEKQPICADCYHIRQQRGLDQGYASIREPGIDDRLCRGVDRSGKRPPGAISWEHRPPQEHTDEIHTDAVAYRGGIGWQRSPPVHVNGSPPQKHSGTRAAKGVDTKRDLAALLDAANLSPTEREAFALQKAGGYSRAEIAARLGVSLRVVKRALEGASAKVRRQDVPQW